MREHPVYGAAMVVRVEAHLLDVLDWAAWCDHCFLPSALRFSGAIVNSATLGVILRFERTVCQDCGAVLGMRRTS